MKVPRVSTCKRRAGLLISHLWLFSLAPNQQNAAGIRTSGALPWQQTNASADGSSRIKAQHSSQQGGSGVGYLIKPPSWFPEPSAETAANQLGRLYNRAEM